MNAIEKLKNINLVDHISQYLGPYKKERGRFVFHSGSEDKTASLVVYEDQTRGYNDFSGRYGGGTIIDFDINYFKIEKAEAIKNLCEKYGISDEKKEFKKSPKRHELVERFEDFRLNGLNPQFSRFLQTRGLSFEMINGEFKERINEVAKEIGFCENQFVDKDTFKDVIIIPSLNENKQIIGAMLRRCDGEKIIQGDNYLKSVAISKPKEYKGTQQFSTGLLFSEISDKYVLICEGFPDYLILKILGFNSVICNNGGVSSNGDKIQQLVKNVDKIVCLYDNDGPGLKGTIELQEKIGRPIRMIKWKKIDGLEKYDVNDLFKMGYRKKDFDELIRKSKPVKKEELIKEDEKQKLFQDRYFYNDTKMEYFDVKDFSFKTPNNLARHLYFKLNDLEKLRKKGEIPSYEGVCYFDGGKKGFYNLLDKSKIAHPSNNPIVHDDIKFLIGNLCNFEEQNIHWLEKAILYKYTHLNDVIIPAVVFHGIQGTGKGLFVELLSQIFGENNTQTGLTQENIDSEFSAYSGQKLIVEFKELSVDNTAKGKKNMNKLKTFIMEKKIMIRKMRQDPISTENIAWFIMSSNESRPILLDSSDSGNRRFSIIRTGKYINKERGQEIADTIADKENIENFLAYLFQKFPNIENEKAILPLDNEDKRDLEYLSETVPNLFFKWFEDKYPNINKITNQEKEILLEKYRIEIGETEWNDERYKTQYFNANLSMKYKPTVINIRGKSIRGYRIDKEVNGDGVFEEGFFEKTSLKPKGIL